MRSEAMTNPGGILRTASRPESIHDWFSPHRKHQRGGLHPANLLYRPCLTAEGFLGSDAQISKAVISLPLSTLPGTMSFSRIVLGRQQRTVQALSHLKLTTDSLVTRPHLYFTNEDIKAGSCTLMAVQGTES